jgi:hypothetical protein
MIKTDCNVCQQKDIPLNETVKIDGKLYCTSCCNTDFPNQESLKGHLVEKEYDPTVCVNCKQDFDTLKLNKLAAYPVCTECAEIIEKRAFPPWVKAFFAAILVIVIGASIWNWKYYTAYRNIQKANKHFEMGENDKAYKAMYEASMQVPEVEGISTYATYLKGISLLEENKNSEAIEAFNKCREKMPAGNNVVTLINQARIGIAFDNKNYEDFVVLALDNLNAAPESPIILTSVASAYACVYADRGVDSVKQLALEYLNKAKSFDDTSAQMKQYYNRIEHRLATRTVITSEQFSKQFPKGWTKI